MVAPEGACSLIPENVSDIDAANLIYAYGSAYYGLIQRAKLISGGTLLVTGATGGVGLAALEVGRLLNTHVIAVVGSDKKREIALQYGADGRGIDVCFEMIGGNLFEVMARSMNWNERLLTIGFAFGEILSVKINLPLVKNYSIVGSVVGAWWERCRPEEIKANDEIFRWASEGKIHPKTDRIMPLEEACQALELLVDREVTGRIALSVPE